MGLGRSGRAAAALAMSRGDAVVCVDLNLQAEPVPGAQLELGPHRRQTFLDADEIVVSPGIPARQCDIVAAQAHGVKVIGELGFAAGFLDLPTVAITGTNGKSTVTALMGQILRFAGHHPFVGGNLGSPLSLAVGNTDVDSLVIEVSSYQLELPGGFAPDVSVILNLTPDHLARHGNMQGYAKAKAEIFARATVGQVTVLPVDTPLLEDAAPKRGIRLWLGGHPGVIRDGNTAHIVVPFKGVDKTIALERTRLAGEHNKDNLATAALLAVCMGVDVESIQSSIASLEALAHRMEPVGALAGVLWINDSKATNVDASRVGISGLDRPLVVLLGGKAKGPGFAMLSETLAQQRATVCFGGDGPQIAAELRSTGLDVQLVATMDDALCAAQQLAQTGDAVLLSPGCASFDEFENFEHRGRVFRAWVEERLS